MSHQVRILSASLLVLLHFSGCSKSNNLLLGRVEAKVGTHIVVVTDCYRTSVPPPELLKDSQDGKQLYRFAPCVDADVVINGEQLIVNGRLYGSLNPTDTVIVDHGKVLVNDHTPGRGD